MVERKKSFEALRCGLSTLCTVVTRIAMHLPLEISSFDLGGDCVSCMEFGMEVRQGEGNCVLLCFGQCREVLAYWI